MDDTISRQDFDKCLEEAEKEAVKNRKYVFASALNTIRGNLRNFPSAQPERKNGKWNTYYHSDIDFSHSCNQCGYSAPYQMIGGEVFQKKWNFCPHCGARMEVSE